MNISYNEVQQVSHNLHNFCRQKGENEAFKKVLDILRVNPLLAIKIIKSCSLCKYTDHIYAMLKDIVYSISPWNSDVILNNKMPYTILLIEALYVNDTYADSSVAEKVLMYAQAEDKLLYKQGKDTKYLTYYNIRHIFRNIPPHKQIEFILLFWKQHKHASRAFGKQDSYSSRCIDIMLKELKNRSFWTHFENKDLSLSEREEKELDSEIRGIRLFIEEILQNEDKNHLHYVKAILGEDQLIQKFEVIMGTHPRSMGIADLEKEIEESEKKAQKRKQERTEAYRKNPPKKSNNKK